MILLEMSDPDRAAQLTRDLPARGKSMGLSLSVAPQSQAQAKHVNGLPYRLKTYSMDQPGIIARLTKILRETGVNIEELGAWQESAAFAGTPLFLTQMRLTIPPEVPVRKLRAELESLCNDLNCDCDLEPAEG
jgi:glycine cleavage system transcriptional repressor